MAEHLYEHRPVIAFARVLRPMPRRGLDTRAAPLDALLELIDLECRQGLLTIAVADRRTLGRGEAIRVELQLGDYRSRLGAAATTGAAAPTRAARAPAPARATGAAAPGPTRATAPGPTRSAAPTGSTRSAAPTASTRSAAPTASTRSTLPPEPPVEPPPQGSTAFELDDSQAVPPGHSAYASGPVPSVTCIINSSPDSVLNPLYELWFCASPKEAIAELAEPASDSITSNGTPWR